MMLGQIGRLLSLLLLLVLTAPAGALELWVDRDSIGGPCSDSRTREQVAMTSPWCTLDIAGSSVLPGDTVRVRTGIYNEVQFCPSCNDNTVLQIVVSGNAGARIRFEAFAGETVIVDGSGGALHGIQVIRTFNGIEPRFIDIVGFVVRDIPNNCIAVKNTSDVLLSDLDISGCVGGAVELHSSARVTLQNSRIHDNALGGYTSAVDLYQCLDGNIVRGNFIWANTDEDANESEGHGITMDYCLEQGGALIENNVIWDNEGWCMALYFSDGGVIRNNTCWHNGNGRPSTGEISMLGRNHSIHNNILLPRADRLALNIRERSPEYVGHLNTIEEDSNILWAPTHDIVAGWSFGSSGTVAQYQTQNPAGWGVDTLQLDPRLVAPATQDFQLQPDSPAIDSGDDAHAAALDIDGGVRPLDGDGNGSAIVDRGAYEFLFSAEDLVFRDHFEGNNIRRR